MDFYCRVDEDPFTVMRLGGKKYGWNIMGVEFMATIPTLFETTMDFLKTWQNKYPPPSPLKSSLVHLSTFSSSSSTSSPSDSLDRLSGKFTPEPYFTASTTLPNFLFPRHMRPFLSNLQFLSTTTSLPNHPYPDSSTPPSYNGMHFWSNFEIADLDWFRGEEYSAYFSFLDETGGFFYERWGDAPIHSLAVAMFLDESEVHHFYG